MKNCVVALSSRLSMHDIANVDGYQILYRINSVIKSIIFNDQFRYQGY